MSKLGNSAENQAFTPIIDTFNGNGSTTAFTLTYPVASVAQVEAYISNVPQQPGVAYTVLGNTITFTSAPPSGTANVYVRYTSPITQIMQPGQGTVGTSQMVDAAVTAAKIASGQVLPAAGITFPATQSASSDANTLDDYEEGTFTPTVFGSTVAGTTTYNSSSTYGRYVKVGQWVFVEACVTWSTSSGASGGAQIGGLPFTVANFTNHFPTGTLGYYNYGSSGGWQNSFQSLLLAPNTTTGFLYYSASNNASNTTVAILNSGGGQIYFNAYYLAA